MVIQHSLATKILSQFARFCYNWPVPLYDQRKHDRIAEKRRSEKGSGYRTDRPDIYSI